VGGRGWRSSIPNTSTLRVSVAGQPDFLVTTANGAYSWRCLFLSRQKAERKHPRRRHSRERDSRRSSYRQGRCGYRIQLAKLQGDNQTGMPRRVLPLTLRPGVVWMHPEIRW